MHCGRAASQAGGSEVWIHASDWRRAAAVVREQNLRRRERSRGWSRSRRRVGVLRLPEESSGRRSRPATPEEVVRSEPPLSPLRSGEARARVRRARWRQSFSETLRRARPWTRSTFIPARLPGSALTLVPYLVLKSPLARWAGVSSSGVTTLSGVGRSLFPSQEGKHGGSWRR